MPIMERNMESSENNGNTEKSNSIAPHPSISKTVHTIEDIKDAVNELLWKGPCFVERINGGVTNQIYKAWKEGTGQSTIVRIFGAQDVFSEEDRKNENIIVKQLGDEHIGPSLMGTFKNGRMEEYFSNSRRIELSEMSDTSVMRGVAKEIAKLHRFQPSKSLAISKRSKIWDDLDSWITGTRNMNFNIDKEVEQYISAVNRAKIQIGDQTENEIVFSHNDLLSGNIMKNEKDDSIQLIDFEYSGFNYRAFDIGNFFAECMGGTENGVVYPDLYPSASKRKFFCHTYLSNVLGRAPEEEELENLIRKADEFVLISHLYWGFWALVQSKTSTVDFPYVDFARQRFQEFSKKCNWD